MNAPLKSIKGYELRERIGTGGFGAVYKAYQTTIGRDVAIKVILPDRASHPDFIRRFEGEAQMVARLEHPHIVPLYDYWRDPDGAYLVMRWLRGGSLRDALANGAYDLQSAARLLDQIAGALTLAHRSGVIHRDIKPGNILLDEDGNAYLTDFGIAKDLSVADGATAEDAILGSLDYISPEQARSAPVSPRTDIYSLGVTLYEMLTGQHPFVGLSAVERLYKHINDPLPAITLYDAPVREAVNAVITTATAKNPDRRFTDVLTFAAEFRAAAGQVAERPEEVLTLREQEILALVIDGLANKEIAQRLTLTLGTVKWHVNQIYAKLGVRSRVQAIVRSRELNLIRRGEDAVNTVAGMVNVPTVRIPTEEFHPVNPYKGLLAFQSADHQDFYGREKLVSRLIRRLGETGEYHRFLAVVGPSGSGKSSLVKAGLIPALWRGDLPGAERWFVVEMLPGAHPLDELEVALIRVAANQAGGLNEQLRRDERGLIRAAALILPADGTELVLVIDQFEEVYTLLTDETERQQFLDLLCAAVTEPRSRVRVIITLRADFYDRPLHDPRFGELVHSRLETILPLSAEELEQAITRPAERVGVNFEPGLVTTIVGEVNYQPGALPLLQYALTELFEAREGRVLTREAYHQIGGTVGALARRADEVFLGLREREQAAAQQIFLRLVTLGEGTEDTRRRTPRSELKAVVEDADLLDDIIEAFTAYRLLALDTDPGTRTPTVELAHEALIREWERLRGWLNDAREDIKLQRQIAALAADWHEHERDPGLLVRGSRLRQFASWADETSMALTSREREYLAASAAEQTRQQEAEAAQQQREAALEQQSRSLLRGLVGVLALALVGALILSGVALTSADEARQERENVQVALATSDANFARAEQQRLALAANEAMDRGATGNVGLALALRSLEYGYNPGADAALQRATGQGFVRHILAGHDSELYAVAYSPDGTQIATSSIGVRLYDAANGQQIAHFPSNAPINSISFSPDGALLAMGGNESIVQVAEVRSGAIIATLAHSGQVQRVRFSPDGTQLFTYDSSKTLTIWDVFSASLVSSIAVREDEFVTDIGFVNSQGVYVLIGADGQLSISRMDEAMPICTVQGTNANAWVSPEGGILIVQQGSAASVRDLTTCDERVRLEAHTRPISAAAFSQDGEQVFTGDDAGVIHQWDTATGMRVRSFVTETRVLGLAVAPDRQTLVTTGFPVGLVYNLGGTPLPITFETELIATWEVQFSPTGRSVLIGSPQNAERWDFASRQREQSYTYSSPLRNLAMSPDERYIFASIDDPRGLNFSLYLFDAQSGEMVREFAGHTGLVNIVDYSANGTQGVSASYDSTIRIWNIATGETVHELTGHQEIVGCARFSPDGLSVVSSSIDGTARVWNAQTGESVHILQHELSIVCAAYSTDGRFIATGDVQGRIYLWDASVGRLVFEVVVCNEAVFGLAFSPDGETFAAGCLDGSVHFVNLHTEQVVRIIQTDASEIYLVDYSPDGDYVLAGTNGSQAYAWPSDLSATITTICAQPLAALTETQMAQYGLSGQDSVCPQG